MKLKTSKPDLRNFGYMLKQLKAIGFSASDVMHVAQSLFHDHEPAVEFGLATAWINRRHDQDGWGATLPPARMPPVDFTFRSLAELVERHQQELRGAV